MTTRRHGANEKTEVLYGVDKNVKAILEFINRSNNRYDVMQIPKVELQQHTFDSLWKTAILAEQRIKEIENEIGAEDSRSKESHKTIQLWTNQDQNQYAIRLEGKSDLLATTNQDAQYTNLVEESDYLEELEYD